MAKIVLDFEGPLEALNVGIECLAKSFGYSGNDAAEQLESARQRIGALIRQDVTTIKNLEADIGTQAIVDAALAQKEAILAQTQQEITGTMDTVLLKVKVED